MNYQKIEVLVAILDVIFEFRVKNPQTELAPRPNGCPFYEAQHKTIRRTNSMKSIASKILSLIMFFHLRLSIYILKTAFYLNLTVLGELSEN